MHLRRLPTSYSQKAADQLEKQAPRIQAKIDEAQKQLNSLARDAETSARRLGEMESAVVQLRECAPAWIRAQVASELATLGQTSGAELGEMRTRKLEIETLLSAKHEHEEDRDGSRPNPRTIHCGMLPATHPCSLADRSTVQRDKWVAAWNTYAGELRSELKPLARELEKLEAEYKTAVDKLYAKLNAYIS
jgi:chromosome condensin MukBEF ATPase and DNA-binding subunit MukB